MVHLHGFCVYYTIWGAGCQCIMVISDNISLLLDGIPGLSINPGTDTGIKDLKRPLGSCPDDGRRRPSGYHLCQAESVILMRYDVSRISATSNHVLKNQSNLSLENSENKLQRACVENSNAMSDVGRDQNLERQAKQRGLPSTEQKAIASRRLELVLKKKKNPLPSRSSAGEIFEDD